MGKKSEQLKKILEKVDLTETQRERAVELYTHVCKTIEEKSGLEINFYPQGSFATKTATRPYVNGKDHAYDVDVICEVNIEKNLINPENLKRFFRKTIENSRYSNDFEEWDKCFTIDFKERDGVDFSIDIIPSVHEDYKTLQLLISKTENPDLVENSIAIPNTDKGIWLTNNPKGYVKWFENEIEKFHKRFLLEKHDTRFLASIEELPEDEFNNNLLDVIKILKRTRDVFYSRRKSENKPSSIIITTVVVKLAKNLNYFSGELDLLMQVVTQLQQLKNLPMRSKTRASTRYAIFDIITHDKENWVLNNPANGGDNLLSSWNEEKNKSKDFFDWVDNLQNTFSNVIEKSNEERTLGEFYNEFAVNVPEELSKGKKQFSVTSTSPKPWKEK